MRDEDIDPRPWYLCGSDAPSMPSPSPLLEIRNVSKRFGAVHALKDVSFEVRAGEVIGLLGDNGAGKSTLVKIIAGNLAPDEGELLFDGQALSAHNPAKARSLGIETVYQDLSLCPNLDVSANFFMGREPYRRVLGLNVLDEPRMRRETQEALTRIGSRIPSVRQRVEVLSGGQRQAVELARFVHWGGRLVMLDEPFAALGVEQTRKGLELIRMVRDRGVGLVVVTHNMVHAFQAADRLVVMRLGRVAGIRTTAETSPDEIVALITGSDAAPSTDPHRSST